MLLSLSFASYTLPQISNHWQNVRNIQQRWTGKRTIATNSQTSSHWQVHWGMSVSRPVLNVSIFCNILHDLSGLFFFGVFALRQTSDVIWYLWPNVSEKPKWTASVQLLLFIRYAILQSNKINFTKSINACRFAVIALVQAFVDRVLNWLFH